MNQILFPLLLTSIAGLAGCIGFFAIFIPTKNTQRLISAALGFSAGVMITVSLSDLLPQSLKMLESTYSRYFSCACALLFMIIGAIFACAIDKFLPQQPIQFKDSESSLLLRLGMVSSIAMMLHNFPEGIATFFAGYSDKSLGISIALAIALHNIPEGLAIALPVYHSTKSASKSLFYVLLAAVAEPLGGLCAYLFLHSFINDTVLGAIFSMVAGIMLYISLDELLPTSRKYGYTSISITSVFCGICVIFLSSAV